MKREGPVRAVVRAWLADPLPREVKGPLDLLARTPGVARVAVLPDVHWSEGVCVGVAVGTTDRLIPEAVGCDIGCGMAAEAYDAPAERIARPDVAVAVLADLGRCVPSNRHGGLGSSDRTRAAPEPEALSDGRLSHVATRDGRVQFATLGRGNHFLELQEDEEGRLWAMVHSGSRAMGSAIFAHHAPKARRDRVGLPMLPSESEDGRRYLADVAWAVAYAEASRAAMLDALAGVLRRHAGVERVPGTRFGCLHNHVRKEVHAQASLWVHRKGAVSAAAGEPGIVPGSMGTRSFHTEGRGCADSMSSCSHGAGRALARGEARRRIGTRDLARQMEGVAYDRRHDRELVEEAPAAYKDIGAVLRAQADLLRVVRRLRPVLVHKGT